VCVCVKGGDIEGNVLSIEMGNGKEKKKERANRKKVLARGKKRE
jgi:hypothetical protein